VNCTEVRAALPGLLYEDLPPDDRVPLDQHLAGCPACRAELAELQRLTNLLDAIPPPPVNVAVADVYRLVADRQTLRLRRWRRVALTAGLAAAVLLACLFGRGLEARFESHQFVLRWGTPPPLPVAEVPAPVPAPPIPVPAPKEPTTLVSLPADAEERLRLLQALVQALADDATSRDLQHQLEVARLRAEVADLRRQDFDRWATVERDVRALYSAYVLTRKGNEP
jgi:anti-sigma factor RsiW